MRPRKDDETLVDVLDVLLRDGAVLRADVIISVADIPLVGLKLTAALAGMETMTEYGFFEEWDVERRQTAITRRQHKRDRSRAPDELERLTVGSTPAGKPSRTNGNERDRESDDERRSAEDAERSRADDRDRGSRADEEESRTGDGETSRENDG